MAPIEQDGVQTHAACPWLPARRRLVGAQPRQLVPRPAAVGGAEQRRVLDSGVDGVRIGRRRLEVPDACELPRMRRAVVPEVRAGDAVVRGLIAHRLPAPATVVGTPDQLPDPAGALRYIQPIRVGGRPLQMVDLPAAEVGPAHAPPLALAVRLEDERALPCTHQYPNAAHQSALPDPSRRHSMVAGTDRPAWP